MFGLIRRPYRILLLNLFYLVWSDESSIDLGRSFFQELLFKLRNSKILYATAKRACHLS